MALEIRDRVKETCTGTNGDMTLTGAVSGFVGFDLDATLDGDQIYYALEDADGTKWEVGLGTLSADSTTLARTTILATQVSFTDTTRQTFSGGTHTIFATYPASKAVYLDASGNLSHTVDLTSEVTGTLPVGNGGTGATSLTDGGILLGSGTGAVTAMSVLGDGVIVVGDNSTDPTTITAFTASDGVLKHEVGGLELDISAIAIGDVIAGTGTGSVGIVTSTGHSDGDVLTIQADGTVDWETPSSGGASNITGLSDALVENDSIYLGNDPSSTTSTAERNIVIGSTALDAVTTADDNIAIGYNAGTAITTDTSSKNILIGSYAGENLTTGSDENVFIGYEAGHGLADNHSQSVVIGYHAGYSETDDRANYLNNVHIGYKAGMEANNQNAVHIGVQAGQYNAGNQSVAIGGNALAGSSSSAIDAWNSIAVGYGAGGSSTGDNCIYLGRNAGKSNTSDKMLFIGWDEPSYNESIIKADMDNKHVAVGVADSLAVSAGSPTFQVYTQDEADSAFYAKMSGTHTGNLIQIQNSSGSDIFVVDKDGEITTGSISGGGARSVSGTTDNGIVTFVNSGSTFAAEANFTYASDELTLTSSTSSKPILHITNTNADATSGELRFNKDSASGADSDVMGLISFYGTDASENTHERLAYIDAIITDSAHGSEASSLRFYVAENDATLTQGLLIAGQADDDGEVDVTIGAGTGSTTTIAGTLTVDSVGITAIQTSGESFADNNTSLMTSAAIADKIEAYGYSTTTGDITGVTAGTGLTGGGSSGGVTLTVDINGTADLGSPAVGDELLISDADDSNTVKKADLASIVNLADHDALTNFVANEHIDHSGVSVTAGDGLSGGGTIASTRTISVDINGASDLTSPAVGDELLISDADDSNAIKKADVASIVNLADHDALTNFVANEHIDHSSVSVSAGTGLTGGGTIASNRTLSVDINGTADLASPAVADELLISDANDSNTVKKADLASIVNLADHDALTNFVANEHVDHSSVSVSAGTGLSGGGTIASTRTLSVDINGTADLASPAVADELLISDADDSNTVKKADLASIVNLADHDALTNFVANEHVDHSSVSVSAGTGLTGGGTIASTRTLAVDINGTADLASPAVADELLISDADDSNTVKKADLASIVNLADHDQLTNFVANEHIDWTASSAGTIHSSNYTNTQLSEEQVEDFVGGMVTGNTETGISVTYQDADGTLDFAVSDTTVAGDSGSTGITPGDTLTIAGGTNATTAMSGDTLTVNVDDAFLKNDADDTTSGTVTMANLIVGDAGNIGSASDTDAIAIASDGEVTLSQRTTFSKAVKTPLKSNTDGATITFDLDEASTHTVTLGDNRTLAISNEDAGQKFIINLVQDGTGSRTVTWFSTIKWAGGSAPTLTTTADKADSFGFLCTGTDAYYGFVIGQNI